MPGFHTTMAGTINPPKFEQLNTRLNALAGDLHHQIALSRSKSLPNIDTIEKLESHTRQYLDQGDAINAINLILLNIKLIKDNLNDNSTLFFLSLLLDNNQLGVATSLFEIIKKEGEKSLKSNASFLFATYYFHENKWQECLQHVADTYTDLSDKQANHALLMTGVSLQHLKDHRKAIIFYERISNTSEYYLYARLNIAVAYIRQGWWTDAQAAIHQALKPGTHVSSHSNEEITNRLYLVLGYSLLQKEYYRDAREAFRNIKTSSRYTNRALLGIALASANQDDLIGALNALSALKNKENIDLSIDESYLLHPFIYKKLGQEMTATTSYNEAIKYYQTRIENLDKPYNKTLSGLNAIKQTRNDYELVINNNLFELNRELPESVIKNPDRIVALLKASSTLNSAAAKKSISKLTELQQDYKAAYIAVEAEIISQRKVYLNSYLNQSRYGLANLFDTSLIDNK